MEEKEQRKKQNTKPKNKLIDNIMTNYKQIEKSIVNQLYMKNDIHGLTIGTNREDIWKQLFEMVIPKKFVIEQSVFIIDASGKVSSEVDLAILDETYTPYIFRYGRLKFIPIEAVAAVVECKSQSTPEEGIKNWCDKITALKTADGSIARIASSIAFNGVATQKSTRPIRIFCTLHKEAKYEVKDKFDFILTAKQDILNKKAKNNAQTSHILVETTSSYQNLYKWHCSLNFNGIEENQIKKPIKQEEKDQLSNKTLSNYCISENPEKDVSLLSFNFQLNQLLMLINNPMLFPHLSYVKMFKDNLEEEEGECR